MINSKDSLAFTHKLVLFWTLTYIVSVLLEFVYGEGNAFYVAPVCASEADK